MSAAGGTPQVVCNLPTATRDHDPAGAWPADDTKELHFHGVSALPSAGGFLYVVHRHEGADTVEVLVEGTRRQLWQAPEGVRDPIYIPSGHILAGRGPASWAMPFDLERLEIRGEPWLVEPEVATFSASATTVALLPRLTTRSRLRWLAADGAPGEAFGEPAPSSPFPALSPDGTRVAIAQQVENEWGMWVHDLARGTRTRLPGVVRGDPAWHPDGRTVFYSTVVDNRPMLTRARADGTPVDQLEPGLRPSTADGRRLFFDRMDGGDFNLYVRDLAAGAAASPFLAEPEPEMAAMPSPDGRLIAYISLTLRRYHDPAIMLRRFPPGDERWQVSTGAWWPRWSRDARRAGGAAVRPRCAHAGSGIEFHADDPHRRSRSAWRNRRGAGSRR